MHKENNIGREDDLSKLCWRFENHPGDPIIIKDETFNKNLMVDLKNCDKIRFENCKFDKGLTIKGNVTHLEFENCQGNIVRSEVNVIFVLFENSKMNIINSSIRLNRSTTIKNESVITYRGRDYDYDVELMDLDGTSELVLKESVLTIEFLNIDNSGVITIDERKSQGESLHSKLLILETCTTRGYIRVLGKDKFNFNGHIIDPKKEKYDLSSKFFRNQYMSLRMKIMD